MAIDHWEFINADYVLLEEEEERESSLEDCSEDQVDHKYITIQRTNDHDDDVTFYDDDDHEENNVIGSTTDDEDGEDHVNSKTVVMITDIEALHCWICNGLLTVPVYQCSKGHAVCNQCRESDENKCMVTCGEEVVGLIRCLAIERVIESAKVQCAFGRYGCKTTIAYRRKKAHELFCSYAPCSCPVLYCSYKGSSNQLSTHFSLKHHPTPAMATNFSYEKLFKVSLDKSEPFVILREEEEGLLFLLHNRELKEGNSVAVRYMAAYSQRSKTGFTYEVVHKTRRGGCLRFESRVERVKSREEAAHRYYSYADFLLIPSSPSYSAATHLQLEMCIKRN